MQTWIEGILIRTAIFFLALIPPVLAKNSHYLRGYYPGDLMFADIDCGMKCDSIEIVSQKQIERLYKIKVPRLTHVFIYNILDDGSETAIDTMKETGVRQEALKTLIEQLQLKGGINQLNGIYPVRWNNEYRDEAYWGVKRAERMMGTPYDKSYRDPKRPYCSLLIQQVMLSQITYRPLFDLIPMEFGDYGSPERKRWEDIAKADGYELPIGLPGISPAGLFAQGISKNLFKTDWKASSSLKK